MQKATEDNIFSIVDKLQKEVCCIEGGTIPSGTDGQTLYFDGTTLTSTSNLINDGTNVGIGGVPFYTLDIKGEVQVTASASYGRTLTLYNNGQFGFGDIDGNVGGTRISLNDVATTATYDASVGHSFNGHIGMGVSPNANTPVSVAGLPAYANNAAALLGGLVSGDVYRISTAGTSVLAIVE